MSITDTGFDLHGSETTVALLSGIFLHNHIKGNGKSQASLPLPPLYPGAKSFSEITHFISPHVLLAITCHMPDTKPIKGKGNWKPIFD